MSDPSDVLIDGSDAPTDRPTQYSDWRDATINPGDETTLPRDSPSDENALAGDELPPPRVRPDALAVRENAGDN